MQAAAEIGNFRGQTIREWVCWLQRMVSGHAAKARRHHFAEKRTIAKENEMAVTVSVDGEQSSPDAVLMSLEQAALVAEKWRRFRKRCKQPLFIESSLISPGSRLPSCWGRPLKPRVFSGQGG